MKDSPMMLRAIVIAASLLYGALPVQAQVGPPSIGHAPGQAQGYSERNIANGYVGMCADGTVGCQNVIPTGSLQSSSMADLTTDYGLLVDRFRQTADGSDYALAIQRLINLICSGTTRSTRMEFLSHHYAVNSPISQSCLVHWRGPGWQEQFATAASIASAKGAWLDIGTAFAGIGTSPITVSGFAAIGSSIEGIAFAEPGQTAEPTAVLDGSGHVTGWSPSTWTPVVYPYVLTVNGTPGVALRRLMFAGVYDGVISTGSGRTSGWDIRGQAFDNLVSFHYAYDVSRLVDVHAYPYYSASDPVLQYTQANADTVRSGRNDTPMFDRVFAIAQRSVLAIANDAASGPYAPGGTTTGAAIGTLSCDLSKYCLWVQSGAQGAQLQIANLRSFGQIANSIYGASPAMLPGSTVIQIDGYATIQGGTLDDFGTDQSVVNFTNTSAGSNVVMSSTYADISKMSAGASVVKFPTTGAASNFHAGVALLAGSGPAGFTLTNTSPNGAGTGALYLTSEAVQH